MNGQDLRPLDREPVSIRPPYDVRRAPIWNPEAAQADRLAALLEPLAGVRMGAYDQQIVRWLAGWDIPTVGTVVSLLHRARAATPPVRGAR